MTEAIVFTIPGVPVAKARPRVTRTHTYTPQKTKDYERLVQWSFRNNCKGHEVILKPQPIFVTVKAYFPIPKNTSKKNRAKMLSGEVLHTKRPDWDNVAKAITDALNGLAYEDDSQVMGKVIKLYSDEPRVEVEMRWGDGTIKHL